MESRSAVLGSHSENHWKHGNIHILWNILLEIVGLTLRYNFLNFNQRRFHLYLQL